MSNETATTEAGPQYEAAHEMHYTAKNLREALGLYKGILAMHPDSKEAGYARSQIQNIVHSLVPKEVLTDTQAELALSYIDLEDTN